MINTFVLCNKQQARGSFTIDFILNTLYWSCAVFDSYLDSLVTLYFNSPSVDTLQVISRYSVAVTVNSESVNSQQKCLSVCFLVTGY